MESDWLDTLRRHLRVFSSKYSNIPSEKYSKPRLKDPAPYRFHLNISRSCFAVLACFCTSSAIAQNTNADTILGKLYACSDIADPNARLACFDKGIESLKQGEKSKEIVILDKTEVKAAKKAAFGFAMPKIKIFDDDDAKAKNNALEVTVLNIGRQGPYPLIRTSEDQEWLVLEEEEIQLFTKPPYKAKIKSASLGSFLLQFEGRNKSYRVRRVK